MRGDSPLRPVCAWRAMRVMRVLVLLLYPNSACVLLVNVQVHLRESWAEAPLLARHDGMEAHGARVRLLPEPSRDGARSAVLGRRSRGEYNHAMHYQHAPRRSRMVAHPGCCTTPSQKLTPEYENTTINTSATSAAPRPQSRVHNVCLIRIRSLPYCLAILGAANRS